MRSGFLVHACRRSSPPSRRGGLAVHTPPSEGDGGGRGEGGGVRCFPSTCLACMSVLGMAGAAARNDCGGLLPLLKEPWLPPLTDADSLPAASPGPSECLAEHVAASEWPILAGKESHVFILVLGWQHGSMKQGESGPCRLTSRPSSNNKPGSLSARGANPSASPAW